MRKRIFLNSSKPEYTFNINPERPYFKLLGIALPENIEFDPLLKKSQLSNTNAIIKKYHKQPDEWKQYPFFHGNSIVSSSDPRDNYFLLNDPAIKDNQFKNIKIELQTDLDSTYNFAIDIELFATDIELHDPFLKFENHISNDYNAKILFSAPFGQGKTTFLNHFFEERKDAFEVFRIYPVHYSISQNEDVFKFLKVELLFQLLKKGLEFEKSNLKFVDTFPAYFKKNAATIIAPFIKLIPKIGETAFSIYKELYGVAKDFLNYHEEMQINDEKAAIKFLETAFESEGSIFEDNFYTQLIRQLIAQLREQTGKQIVLLIDDTDRMDPEHIFRILNVFAAHFDKPEYLDGYSNKLGVDKIIIVADYDNLKNIFAHKYGASTYFPSYINKYFSVEPFFYDNSKAIASVIERLTNGEQDGRSVIGTLGLILEDLVHTNNLSLRELLKFQRFDLSLLFGGLTSARHKGSHIPNVKRLEKFQNSKFYFFNIFYFLERIGDIDIVIEKLIKCKDSIIYDNNKIELLDLEELICFGTGPLIFGPNEYGGLVKSARTFQFKNMNFDLSMVSKQVGNFQFIRAEKMNPNPPRNVKYTAKDFYDVLILNARKYKEYGGLGR